jgi:hypothetical protein
MSLAGKLKSYRKFAATDFYSSNKPYHTTVSCSKPLPPFLKVMKAACKETAFMIQFIIAIEACGSSFSL